MEINSASTEKACSKDKDCSRLYKCNKELKCEHVPIFYPDAIQILAFILLPISVGIGNVGGIGGVST